MRVKIHRNLFDSIAPLLKLSTITGLSPVICQKQGEWVQIRWSWQLYFLSFTFGLILASWGLWGFVKDMELASFVSLGFTGSIDIAISTSDVSDVIFSSFYFITCTPSKFRHLKTIVTNFQKIDLVLPPRTVKEILQKTTIFGTLWMLFLPVLYMLDLLMWGIFNWSGLNSYCGYYISYSIVIMHELQYWLLITMTRDRIFALNTRLKELKDREVTVIINTYHCIIKAVDTINTCFSIRASMMILSCYVHLVTCPYQLFVMLTSNDLNILNFVYLIWVSLQIFRLMLILEVCHRCTDESLKTKKFVVLLLASRQTTCGIKDEIKRFFILIVKKKIKFQSYALPKIDRSLLLSISASISTYWMILLQFSSRSISAVIESPPNITSVPA